MATTTAESSAQSNGLSREQLRQVRWAQLAQIADGPDLFLALLVYPDPRNRPCLSPQELLDRLARLAVRLRDIADRSGRLDAALGSGLPRLVLGRLSAAGLIGPAPADIPLLPDNAGLPGKAGSPGDVSSDDVRPPIPPALGRIVTARVLVWAAHMEDILTRASAPASAPPAPPHPDEERLWRLYTREGRYHLLYPDGPCWPGQKLGDLYPTATDTDREQDDTSAPPLCLWVEGEPDLLDDAALAIVGSRQASSYGLGVTADCARTAAASGYVVVTGGAMGVDGQANRAVADIGYPSIAVFAGGLDTTGPARNLPLFAQIVRTGGALVSELPPWVVPRSYRFLERNRLIAALSDAVLVTQARFRSGALNTAAWARKTGRPVIVVPGPVTDPASGGCNTQLRLPPETRPDVLTRVDMLPTLIEEGMTAARLEQSRLRRAHARARVIGAGVPDHASFSAVPALVPGGPTDADHTSGSGRPTDTDRVSGTGRMSGTDHASSTDRASGPDDASDTARPSASGLSSGSGRKDGLTQAIIDLLRPRRQNASQLYAALLPCHPGLSAGKVLARLSWLEEEQRVSIDEAGRASLIEER